MEEIEDRKGNETEEKKVGKRSGNGSSLGRETRKTGKERNSIESPA